MFSTAPEAEPFVDKNAEACVLCHASAQPLVRWRRRPVPASSPNPGASDASR